jgi:tetratricopeptide (TPR) repeat protein
MKVCNLMMVLLAAASFALAQTSSQPSQNPKPGAQGQQQPPAAGQAPAPGQAPVPGQAAPAPAGKRQPQAKSKDEYSAYMALMQMTDAAAMEKAADEFVAKYPDSELKGAVYQRTMAAYQSAGNSEDKTLEMGHKSLTYNPDDPGVLVSIAELIASRTRETDLDKDERLSEASKYAKHALETVTDYPAPPQMPPDQVAKIKDEMRGTAYSVLGMAAYTNKNYADAIANFKQSIDVTKDNPDPTVYLRLTLALDKAGRYPEALEAANKTLALPGVQSQVTQLATQEKTRLEKLASVPKPAASPAPTSPQPQSVQPH